MQFRDLSVSPRNRDAVLWAVEKKVMSGVTDTEFRPTAPVTRGEMALALWRAAGSPQPVADAGNPFRDVSPRSPYYVAVLWAAERGVTKGVTADTFRPDSPVTRAQAVTFFYRLMGKSTETANPYVDVADGYFRDAALWAYEWGIARGLSDGVFGPGEPCTRLQAAVMLCRCFGR